MKAFAEIDLGYGDAANYKNNRKYKELFSKVFVKDEKLDRLMREDTYYLIGDKGTGKTAYSVFLENSEYQNTQSKVINLEATDYKIFLNLRKLGFLQLSDFSRIWKIILLLMTAESIQKENISSFGPKRSALFEKLKSRIDAYYENAYIPEIAGTIKYIFDEACSMQAGLSFSTIGLGSNLQSTLSDKLVTECTIQKFQNNLADMERQFCDAFSRLKINKNKFIFIDSIMKAIQRQNKKANSGTISTIQDFKNDDTENEISNYYIDEAKDWCLHKFSDQEFITLIFFFQFLDGKSRFDYKEYKCAFEAYQKQVGNRKMGIFEELLDADAFLQLLYDLNMICYYDKDNRGRDLFRFCYREREVYNLSPKVKTDSIYGVHYALLKALNLGWTPMPSESDIE